MESTKFYSFYTLRGKIEAVQQFTLQDLHRDLLCVPGNCGCPQYWLFVPPRWQGEKWPARWPAHTSALPGTLMSGLFLFWDARLVSTSSWGTVCLSPTKWTYMKKELMRWFLQRILKSGRPLLIHNSHNQDPYYFFTFGSGGSLFQLFGLLHFVLSKSCAIHLLFLPFLGLVLNLLVNISFLPKSLRGRLCQGILLPFTHLTLTLVGRRAGSKTDDNTQGVLWVIPAASSVSRPASPIIRLICLW